MPVCEHHDFESDCQSFATQRVSTPGGGVTWDVCSVHAESVKALIRDAGWTPIWCPLDIEVAA